MMTVDQFEELVPAKIAAHWCVPLTGIEDARALLFEDPDLRESTDTRITDEYLEEPQS